MAKHLHKRVEDDFIKFIFKQYLSKQLSLEKALEHLKIKRSRFFKLLKEYKNNPESFSITYERNSPKRIENKLERIIIDELKKDKKLIMDKNIPVKNYNYSYIRNQIMKDHKTNVSLPTIIKRAKEHHYYITKRKHKKHDREVITNYPGELIQHDSSHHLFAPLSNKKWYLITSIDDYSRFLLHAALLERESSWSHISALESVILRHGMPLRYYVDSHSIFRFVQGRDSIWREHKKLTDEVPTQFKQVLQDLNVDLIYALSPQAKGKIERPYQWLQDHLVRTCARESIKTIESAQQVLKDEVRRYNYKQVHSTTREIPAMRFEKAIKSNKTMFREFKLKPPFESTKDIFCLRETRKVDAYHKISINNIEFHVQGVSLRENVGIKIIPDKKKGVVELRFWHSNKCVDKQYAKLSDFKLSTFEF
jgi:hypothetical protein